MTSSRPRGRVAAPPQQEPCLRGRLRSCATDASPLGWRAPAAREAAAAGARGTRATRGEGLQAGEGRQSRRGA